MSNKPTYINLPIYSIATYNEYFFLSGGGGGKTGIKNQIFIYKGKITKQPTVRIQTGGKIVQNMLAIADQKILIASANQQIKIYVIGDGGKQIQQIMEFQGDFAPKNSTLYSLSYLPKKNILGCAGQDMTIRFFQINIQTRSANKYFEHNQHANGLKNIDNNELNLFVSTDSNEVIVSDMIKKCILRKVYQDQLKPEKSLFQSAHFINAGQTQLVFCHFIMRKAAYVTKENKNKTLQTAQITKDQSCLTAYHRGMKTLGIACGNGSTYLVKATNLTTIGKDHKHGFVITGGTISRGGRFITGTPECSYHVQEINEPFCPFSLVGLFSILLGLVVIFLLGSQLTFSDISQSQL